MGFDLEGGDITIKSNIAAKSISVHADDDNFSVGIQGYKDNLTHMAEQDNAPISVIMVSYKTGSVLKESLVAALQDPEISEIILIDNGNDALMRGWLGAISAQYPKLSLLQGHGNIGFGRACNYGAALARGEYLLFVNPDAVIKSGSAKALSSCGRGLKRPWITGGLLRDHHGQEQGGARRGALTPLSAIMSFTGLHKIFGRQSIHQHKTPTPDAPIMMQTISGAFMMMDQASFTHISGFDERYFLHVEDIDICRRVRLAGGQIQFVPQAQVTHYGATSKAHTLWVEFQKYKGFMTYFWHYKPGWLCKFLTGFAAPFIFIAIIGRVLLLGVIRKFTVQDAASFDPR